MIELSVLISTIIAQAPWAAVVILVLILYLERRLSEVDKRFAEVNSMFSEIDRRFTDVNVGLSDVSRRLSEVESRLGKVEGRLDNVEDRLTNVEVRLDRVEERLTKVESRLEDVDRRVGEVERRLARVEERLGGVEKRIEGLDERMERLEERVGGLEGRLGGLELRVERLEVAFTGFGESMLAVLQSRGALSDSEVSALRGYLIVIRPSVMTKYYTEEVARRLDEILRKDLDEYTWYDVFELERISRLLIKESEITKDEDRREELISYAVRLRIFAALIKGRLLRKGIPPRLER